MQAYMKSAMPFRGVQLPLVRRVCRAPLQLHPIGAEDEFESVVRALFLDAAYREERYAAVFLARSPVCRRFQTPARIPLYEQMVVAGAWWDAVDEIADNLIGPILLAHPHEVSADVLRWMEADDRWLRRTSILCQLSARSHTDVDLLTRAIDANLDDRDFFLRKAIGWALRQYARTDADWARRFVEQRSDRMSGLSKREALKHIGGSPVR